VAAFRALAEDDLELKIFGGFGDFPEYVARLRALAGGDPRIAFCGTFPNSDIGTVLAGIDVLVVPSVWCENTPLVVFSAQEAGCPVIASDMAGLSEAIRHEENGLLFAPGDAGALRETILRVANDRALLPRLSRACRKPRSAVDYVDQLEESYKMARETVTSRTRSAP
jgi:glycosyltransferase involved in cell wall biosynthesis